MRIGISRLEGDGPIEIPDSFIESILDHQRAGAIEEADSVARIQSERRACAVERLWKSGKAMQNDSFIFVRFCKSRVCGNRAIEACQRVLQPVKFHQARTTIVVRVWRAGIELDRE